MLEFIYFSKAKTISKLILNYFLPKSKEDDDALKINNL